MSKMIRIGTEKMSDSSFKEFSGLITDVRFAKPNKDETFKRLGHVIFVDLKGKNIGGAFMASKLRDMEIDGVVVNKEEVKEEGLIKLLKGKRVKYKQGEEALQVVTDAGETKEEEEPVKLGQQKKKRK